MSKVIPNHGSTEAHIMKGRVLINLVLDSLKYGRVNGGFDRHFDGAAQAGYNSLEQGLCLRLLSIFRSL